MCQVNIWSIKFDRQVSSGLRVFGLDLGKTCYFMSGVLRPDTTIHVDIVDSVRLADLEQYIADFFQKYPVVSAVTDAQPYSDLVYRMVRKHPRLFSAIYVDPVPQPPQLYRLKLQDKHGELVRQVTITKNKLMDMMVNSLEDFVTFEPTTQNNDIIAHLTAMRRVRDYRYEEMVYKWVKGRNKEDHYFHTLAYLYTASKLALADLSLSSGSALGGHNLVSSFKLKSQV
jgi:hypothetical protein